MVKNCLVSAKHFENRREPLLPVKRPAGPWRTVGFDLFEVHGKCYLVVVDYFSRWIETAPLPFTTTACIMYCLKSMFSRYEMPEVFISNNGPQYTSNEFSRFMSELFVTHVNSSPKYPQGNAEAERAVETTKSLLSKNDDQYWSMLAERHCFETTSAHRRSC